MMGHRAQNVFPDSGEPARSLLIPQIPDLIRDAVLYELRVFVPSVDYLLKVRHDLHKAIDREFRKAGIEIAFPQRDIYVRSATQGPSAMPLGGSQVRIATPAAGAQEKADDHS